MKIDFFYVRDSIKRLLIATSIVTLYVSPVFVLILLTIHLIVLNLFKSKIISRKKIADFSRSTLILIDSVMIALCLLWMRLAEYELVDFIRPFLDYWDNILLIEPVRMIIVFSYIIFFINEAVVFKEGMDDWVAEAEIKKREKYLKAGRINYRNRTHELVFGSSGSGKGVLLNTYIRDRVVNDERLVFISAKLASTDPYSQLEYVRDMANRTGRRLYIVSMDETVEDRCKYLPFKHISQAEIQNVLENMIAFESTYYKSNFVSWVLWIFKALKAAHDKITLNNILELYDYTAYEEYVNRNISPEKRSKFLNSKVRRYAEVSINDAANLELICAACSSVFENTPNRKYVNIEMAMKKNAIIYFDLNGGSEAAAARLIGSCVMGEIQHLISTFADGSIPKTVICDEASFFVSDLFISCYNESRSAGYQFIVSTQGPSDIIAASDNKELFNQLSNNSGQYMFLRLNSAEDAERAANLIGTRVSAEITHRAHSVDYDETGSVKAVNDYIVNPDYFKNMNTLEVIYYEKQNDGLHEARPVKITLSV